MAAHQSSERRSSFIANTDENKESITLIWFDSKIESHEEEVGNIRELFRLINDYIIFSFDLEQSIRKIESINKEKIILITSGSDALQILPRIHSFRQLDSIFILCSEKSPYEYLLNDYPKLTGIYTNHDDLRISLKEQIDRINQQIEIFYYFDQHQSLTKDLSKESIRFLWIQLFHHLLMYLSRNSNNKQSLIQMCKEYYHGNRKEITLINEFEEYYRSQDALLWYTKESFVKKLINKALRIEDINFLYQFRFFLIDLTENLQRQQEKILSTNENILIVYRGVQLDKEEFNKIKNNQNKLLSPNGYFSATRRKYRAIEFTKRSTRRTDMISVLLHIQCDMKSIDKDICLGEIDQTNECLDKHDILFNFNICFEIESIEENDSLHIIKLIVSNEGQKVIRDFIELKQKQTEEMNISIIFGRLLCNLDEHDKSQRFFQQLFHDANDDDDDRAWIEFNIGRVLALRNEWQEARKYYNHAYERMMNDKPPRIAASAHVLNSIGCLLANQEKYDEALDYHQRALEIREKFYSRFHIDRAQSLFNIGLIIENQGKYEDALSYYETALRIQENSYPSVHPNILRSLNTMGIIFYRQGKYEDALHFHRRALKIAEKLYPLGHPDLAYTLNNIGIILRNQGMYNEALENCKKAFDIEQKIYSSNHPNIAKSLGNIGNILSDQEKYIEALDYHQRALAIEEKCYPLGNVDIGHSFNNIGICYDNMNEDKMAIYYYQQALTIYEKFLSRDHPRRQKTEQNIHRLTQEN